jgi:hypothetical protein
MGAEESTPLDVNERSTVCRMAAQQQVVICSTKAQLAALQERLADAEARAGRAETRVAISEGQAQAQEGALMKRCSNAEELARRLAQDRSALRLAQAAAQADAQSRIADADARADAAEARAEATDIQAIGDLELARMGTRVAFATATAATNESVAVCAVAVQSVFEVAEVARELLRDVERLASSTASALEWSRARATDMLALALEASDESDALRSHFRVSSCDAATQTEDFVRPPDYNSDEEMWSAFAANEPPVQEELCAPPVSPNPERSFDFASFAQLVVATPNANRLLATTAVGSSAIHAAMRDFDGTVTAAFPGFCIVGYDIYVSVNLFHATPRQVRGPRTGDRVRGQMIAHVHGRNRWRAVEVSSFLPST